MEKYAAIGKVNLKFNLPAPLLLSAALLILSPLFIGIQNLDPLESAKVLEYYLVFLGVILFPPVFLPEQNREIRDLTDSKYTGAWVVYGIRVLESLAALMVLLAVYMAVMKKGNCQFEFFRLYGGTLATMAFLGGMGIIVYALTDQVVIGYMIPILYYILCISAGSGKLGVFYLFSMSQGEFGGKAVLGAAGILMTAVGIWVRSENVKIM